MNNRRSPTPGWLYTAIVLILGVTLITGVVSWVWLTFEERPLPDGLATLLATIAGGLVGALTAGEMRSRDRRDDQPGPE
jgi:hypothetical protein